MEQIINDKVPEPAGLVPKNLQAFIIVGLALLMILIMAVTGHKKPAVANPATTSSLPNLIPLNEQKISDFQKDIEQTQQESAPQVEAALLQQQKQLASAARPAQPFPSNPYGIPVSAPDASGNYPPGAYTATLPQGAENQPPDPIKEEQKKRVYLSSFADNIALTYRKDLPNAGKIIENSSVQGGSMQRETVPTQDALADQARAALAREGQLLAEAQRTGTIPALPTIPQPASVDLAPSAHAQTEQDRIKVAGSTEIRKTGAGPSREGKEYVLFEGTVLEALLINRLDGSFSGPVNCLISNDIYSHDRQHLLIPAGSKILGEASKVDTFGQNRLAVTFHRLIMPDGYSVSLDQFKGLDQEGASALKDKVNNHYARIFGASIAIGALGGVAEIGTASTLDADSTDRFREGFGAGMANSAEHILDRFLNTLPTVMIREGSRIKIYLSNDLLLPDYTTHTLPSNL